ncbi:MAG: EamA family transporter RarD [Planctomycetota bacterium]
MQTKWGNSLYYLQALAAFVLWGIFPLYWRLLKHVSDPVEIIGHRIVWSLLTLVLCISLLAQWDEIRQTLANRKRLLLAAFAAVLISINWLVFIWAVLNQSVVDASLGYFMNPLFSVVLGVVIFREKLNLPQWLAVGIAAIGLVLSSLESKRIWVSIILALSFALYGVVKKQTKLSAVAGLGLETAILAPVALVYLLKAWLDHSQSYTSETLGLLALGGPITTVPLLLFASASKRVPLVAMGMLQYIGPTIQFGIGAYLDHEPIDRWRLLGFQCVWIALAIFSATAWLKSSNQPALSPKT